ncbi:MAG: hypothetical protein ACREOP_05330 [Thermodesulfobacteriota bacterium]
MGNDDKPGRRGDDDPISQEIRVGYFLTMYHTLIEIKSLFFALLSGARTTDKYIVIPRSPRTLDALGALSKLCGADIVQQDKLKFRTKDGKEEPIDPDEAIKDLYG